ncbi:MAG: NUDIX domain-containing protein [Candidatus Aenigmarchaeota archaeon]|nr:NUDIX domain-containing protein [Candidatus Aenigmarchaeota archaeon]
MDLKRGVDFIGVSIIYFCHDGKGNFLMAKRNNNTTDEHGRWDIGGGKLEFGDSVENTLRREIIEEYCTDVISFEFLGYRDVHRIHNDKKTHWIGLDFKVLIDPNKVKIGEPNKFDQIGWFTLKNIPENIHSQLPKFFELYKNKI